MSQPARRRWFVLSILAAATLGPRLDIGLANPALAQMTIPSTTGKLPTNQAPPSFILGDTLETLRGNWAKPANPHHTAWKAAIEGKANQAPGPAAPTKFAESGVASSIAKAAAFRWAMDPKAPTAAADRAKAIAALKVAAVPGGSEITRNEPTTSYLLAYDFLRLEPIPAADDAVIRERLLAIAKTLGGGESDSNVRGKVGGTRGLAGLLLHDQALLNQALLEIKNHFAYSTTDDGWFTDSQGHYLNYTLPHIAPFVRAYQQASGVDLYPSIKPYVDMSLGLRMPDGRVPCVSNGTNMFVATHLFVDSTDPATAAAVRWHLLSIPPTAFDLANTMNNDWTPTTFFALTPFAADPPPLPRSPTYHSPGQAGVSVFRQDWSSTSDYLCISAGVDSPPSERSLMGLKGLFPAYHSQNDTGAIFLASHGVLLLTSPGYDRRDLSNTPKDFDPKRGDWHNVLLVDGNLGTITGAGGSFPSGENPLEYGGPNRGRTVRPGDFKHTDRLDSAEFADEKNKFKGVCDVATLLMSYNDVTVRRTMAFPNEDYFVVADAAGPDAKKGEHDYAFNLVGRGTQTIVTNTPELIVVKWEADGQQVLAHLTSNRPMTQATASLWLHDHYNVFEATKRLQAGVRGADAAFLCVFETGKAGEPSRFKLTRELTNGELAVTVANEAAGWTDVITAGSPVRRSIEKPVNPDVSGGELTCLRRVKGKVESLVLVAGRSPRLPDDQQQVLADRPLTLSLLTAGGDEIRGTVSADDFAPGTKLTFPRRAGAVAATINGKPAPVEDSPKGCVVTLPSPGSLVVKFKK